MSKLVSAIFGGGDEPPAPVAPPAPPPVAPIADEDALRLAAKKRTRRGSAATTRARPVSALAAATGDDAGTTLG